MSKEKDSQFIKNIFLGDELDVDLRGLNFNSLGLSLSDINIDENDVNNVNDNNAPDEPLSDLSDDQKEEFVKTKKNDNNNKKPNSVNNIKTPLSVNRKEKITKIIDNNQTVNSAQLSTNNNPNKKVSTDLIINSNKSSNIYKQPKPVEVKPKESNVVDLLKPEQIKEKDMNLELVCIHNGEKIYKLSDLFVQQNESVIRRIEKYISKTMNNTEKENKAEVTGETPVKKDINETLELKQMIKKAKRNQKFQKLNFTYNEKYFDKTFFVDNSNINNTLADSLFKSTKFASEKEESRNNSFINMKKENFMFNLNNCGEPEKLKKDTLERNMLNSLFYIKMKLNENEIKDNSSKINDIEENEEVDNDMLNRKKGNSYNHMFDKYIKKNDAYFETEEVNNFNETFLLSKPKNNEKTCNVNNSNLEYIESINNKNVDLKETTFLQKNLEGIIFNLSKKLVIII